MTPPPNFRAELMEMISGCWTTQVCGTAAVLGVPDAFSDGPTDAATIAAKTESDANMIQRLLRAMCSIELARQIDPYHFELSEKGRLLRTDSPGSLNGLARAWVTQFWDAWSGLPRAVQSGKPVIGDAFAEAMANPKMAETLNQSQADRSRAVAQQAALLLNLADCRTLADVGGGYGTVLAALLRANPDVQGILIELAYLEPSAKSFLAKENVADRASFSPSDFFREPLPHADFYVLKSILHDWGDDQCATILANVAAGAAPGSRLVIIEQLLPEMATASPALHSAFRTDLTMMVGTSGRERSEAEFRALLGHAGFRLDRIRATETEFHLIEATRLPES